MKTSNVSHKFRSKDLEWHFLVKYSLSELLVDSGTGGNIASVKLYSMIQDLGVAPECIKRLERTIATFAQEALEHSEQGSLEIPIYIRLFCQKRTFEKGHSANTSKHTGAEHAIEPEENIHCPVSKANGGWGYFVIERGESIPPHSAMKPHNHIDLYLYKEGE